MSLKARLTFLFTSILGGILLLFSVAIYGLVGFTLVWQVDNVLERTAFEVLQITRVNSQGNLEAIAALTLDPSVIVQVWGRNGELIGAAGNLNPIIRSLNLSDPTQNQEGRSIIPPLDSVGLQSSEPLFRDVFIGNTHLRVLTVPLVIAEIDDRRFGTLQVGTNMAVIDGVQQELLVLLFTVSVLAMGIAGLAGWLSTRRALRTLETATETALEITETNDLSRRIPFAGASEDEVGQFVQAFNLNLSRLERLIDTQRRFLADVGHELRTPLTVIKGNVDLMQRFGEMDDEALEGIEEEVERLTRLVGDLLLLAQAEAGKLPLDSQLVEMDTVLLEVFRQAKVLAEGQVNLRIGSIDQVLVCGDRDRLQQVILNLISNGIKYTPSGGEVMVSLGKVDHYAQLEVTDSGPGIPEEDLPHIFERFYRGEKSRMRSRDGKGGFGLGLSIAYWIVVNHGGRIEVDSKPGRGTTFCVWLPLADGDCESEGVEKVSPSTIIL